MNERAARQVRSPGWEAQEPGLLVAISELRRLWQRAWRRPLWCVLLTGLFVTVTAGLAWRKAPHARAQIALRVTEAGKDAARTPMSVADLRGRVTNVGLTSQRLADVIKAQKLSGFGGPRFDMTDAIADLRADLGVEVVRNESIALLPEDERPHSAHIILTYRALDPQQALGVVRALAEALVGAESTRRSEESRMAAEQAGVAAAAAERELAKLRADLILAETRTDPEAVVQAARLRDLMISVSKRLRTLQEARAALDVRYDLQEASHEVEYSILSARIPDRPLGRVPRTLIAALITALIGLPIAALLVGAFDPRMYTAEDFSRLGLTVLGHVPGAPLVR